MNILKLELRRAFGSRGMKLAVLLGMILVVGQAVGFYTLHLNDEVFQKDWKLENGEYTVGVLRDTLYQAFLGGEGFTFFNGVYFSLLPILAVFPFAGSFFKDKESGYMKNLCCRVDRTTYHLAKYTAVFLSGGVAGGLPYLGSFLLAALIYPADFPNTLAMQDNISDLSLFADYYYLHPFIYVLLYLLLIVLFSGFLATLSLLASFWAKNILVVWLVPFMFYTAQALLYTKLDIRHWSVAFIINSQDIYTTHYDMTAGGVAAVFLPLLLISLGGFLAVGRKKEIIV